VLCLAALLTCCGGRTPTAASATPSASTVTPSAAASSEGEGTFGEWVMSGGRRRTYAIHVPPSCDRDHACPLIVAFHGAGGNHEFAERVGLVAAAVPRGFIVAAPDGVSGDWALRCNGCTAPDRSGVDDVLFVATLVGQIANNVAVDRSRVYATGRSDGGSFTHRLSCDYPLAAIGVVAGTMFNPQLCRAGWPVSLIAFHGTLDTVIPVAQGAGAARYRAELDGCGASATVTSLPDLVDDGTSVVRNEFPRCAGGSAVVFYSILGGGHNWPGSPTPESAGVQSQEIQASEEIVEFFAAHTMAR
jgi:polyhydroxybutyrate depolymerase